MRTVKSSCHVLSPVFIFFYIHLFHNSLALEPTTTGYNCTTSNTTSTYPCHTYVYYRAAAPNYLDLANISDLFGVSRFMISQASNISSPLDAPLIQDQPLLIPITCGCNYINSTISSISYANSTYQIKSGDTFYLVSSQNYENLTSYQSVEVVNPTLVPTNLTIGVLVNFPIFCRCPNRTSKANFLISYVFQPSDNLTSIASKFGISTQSVIDENGNKIQPFDTVFIPVAKPPVFNQPNSTIVLPPSGISGGSDNKGAVIGLGVGLGICVGLLGLIVGIWAYRESWFRKWKKEERVERRKQMNLGTGGGGGGGGGGKGGGGQNMRDFEVNLLADVSDTLDKYRVFEIDELRSATNEFHQSYLIHGSVYKGCIDGQVFAIKKMKWNAYEELKILQKVNHSNLVQLEGFCIDPEDATCYLVYEYIENGSLDSWLHDDDKRRRENLNWKTRLRIAIDVANGLQYIHEHTRPQVVHKDIKTSNILLDSKLRAKIANFGLAKSGCNAITMHIVGTQGYMAPEYLVDGVVSTKLDVFSFGVVLLELVSGKEAIDKEGNVLWASVHGVFEGVEEKKVKNVSQWMDRDLLKESISMDSVMCVMSIAVACVSKDPSKRPSMMDIVYALSKSDDFCFDMSSDGSTPLVVAR